MDAAIRFTRLVEGQLLEDPVLRWNHFALFMSFLKVGGLNLATWKLHREGRESALFGVAGDEVLESMERDVKIVALHLEVMGNRFWLWGAQFSRILKKLMIAAGIVPFPAGRLDANMMAIDPSEVAIVRMSTVLDITD
jgi:hypothetical protein